LTGLRGALAAALLGISLSAPLSAGVPSLQAPELAKGNFSSMHMLLEKTFLNIDVATIDVRVGKRVQAEFAKLAAGQTYSEALEQQLASIAIAADEAVIQLEFVRDVPLGRWVDGVRETLEKARRAGLITADTERRVSEGLPNWFQPVAETGFARGDKILYEVRPGALRTVAVTRAGKVLVDRSDKGDAPRVVLASYFASGTDYRTPLLRSLWRPSASP
jgi:hypothetical protein